MFFAASVVTSPQQAALRKGRGGGGELGEQKGTGNEGFSDRSLGPLVFAGCPGLPWIPDSHASQRSPRELVLL